jgi:hypothetical protein
MQEGGIEDLIIEDTVEEVVEETNSIDDLIISEETEIEPIREDEEESGEKDTAIERFFGKNEVTDFFGDISRAWTQGVEQAKAVDPSLDIFYEGDESTDEEILKFIETNKNLAEVDMESDEMKSFNKIYEEEGGGWWGFIKGAAMNPSTLSSMLVSSISGQVNSLISSEQVASASAAGAAGGAAAGAALSPYFAGAGAIPGAITGLMTGSMTAMETGLTFAELLQEEAGGELTKENVRAILNDPEKLHELRKKSAGRGLTIGAIEAATMGVSKGVGSKLASAGFRAAPAIAAATTGAIEIVGGGLGEAGGRLVAGQEMDIAEIGFEAFAGLGSMPVTAGQQLLNINTNIDRVKINNQLKNTEYNNLVEAFDPSTDVTEADLNISQVKNSTKILDEQVDTQVKNTQITPEQGEAIKKNFRSTQSATNKAKRANLKGKNEVEVVALLKEKEILDGERKSVNESSLTKTQEKRIKEIDARLEEVSSTITDVVKEDRKAQVAESVKFAETEGKKFGLKTEAIGSKTEFGERFGKEAAESDGFIQDGTIYINKEVAQETGAVSVGSHELLHGILNKELKGKDATKLVQDFRNQLNNEQLSVLDNKLQAVDEKGNRLYSDDYLTQNPDEALTLFSDAIAKKEIAYDENIFTKLKDFLTPILRKAGFAKIKFETGKDVYNFLREYNKSVKEGKLSEAISELGTEKAEAGGKKFSKSIKVPGIETEQVQTMIDKVANRAAAKFFSGIPQNIREEAGLTRRSYIDSAKSELAGIAEKFDASRAEFDRYMANTGMQRLNSLAKRLGVKSVEDQTTRITEDTKQIAAEEETSRDTRTEREVRQDEREGIKVREKLPKVYDVDKVVKSIRSKAKSLKAKNLKQLKGTALEEVSMMIGRDEEIGRSIFNKISKNADLNKAEMLAVQKFINSNVDIAKGSLIEGYTSDFKATGVVNKLLEKFYNKRSVRSKTGAGLSVQIKKPNISDVEFKQAFGITGKDQANWNQKVVAKKGGVSDILKGFVRNFDQVISSQEIREQLIQDGEAIESLRTLRNGIPPQLFSRTAKNQDIVTQVLLAEDMSSDTFLENADFLRKQGNSTWLASALVNTVSDKLKTLLGRNKLRTIGDEFQREFDPNKSWKDYIKKALKIQLEEADIGVYSTLKQIAKARKIDIKTGIEAYENIDDINVLRSDILMLIDELKLEEIVDEKGNSKRAITDAEISKYILPALVGSYKMGRYKLKDNRKAPSIKLNEGEVFIDEGNIRQGIFGSATDANANAGIDSSERINKQVFAHDSWYNQKLSKKQQKEYGVKFFDDLPLEKRAKFVKNEIQPDGLRAKEILDVVVKKMASLRSENKITPQAASVFIDLQFARMDGLGKLASDVRFIPNNTKADLKKIFKLPKIKRGKNKDGSPKYIEDPFVLEHTIPGNRVKLAAFNAILGSDKASMDLFDSELEQYHSAIIPYNFDMLVNRKDGKELYLRTSPSIRQAGDFALSETGRYSDKSRFPMSLYDISDDTTYGQPIQLEKTVEDSRILNNEEALQSGVQTPADKGKQFSKTNEDILNNFIKMDKALDIATSLDQPVKKIRVFDFDDTLAYTKSDVLYTAPDGAKGKLNAEEFAKQGKELLDQGYNFDFSEFNKVTKGKPGPLLDIAKKIKAARGNEDLFVLTARAPEAQDAIYEFLKSQGVEFKRQNIVGLGNSTGKAKAQWLVGKAAEGYNDFYFADDAMANVAAVKKAMSVLDVKSKVQQARPKFSKNLSEDFNRIIEETEGIGREKTYSEARAKQVGSQKGKRKFWIPFSAEDMLGLIYPLLGKGKTGDAQMSFFKDNLFNPFSKAMESLAAARVQLMADFKALKENLDVPKDLQKEAFDGFTNEQALRMYIWDLQGMETPGASKRDVADAKKIIEGNEKLKTFAEELIKINKEDGYPKPSQSWLAGTITTDLIEGLNDVKRPRYLQQWQENVDAIFSKENLNKLEAIHGSNYIEALENMLTRMKTGKNRIEGSNRMSDRVLDWINGSVGAIMFFNTRSAVLQLISSINFINWNDNNLYAAGKAFANQKQYWSDFKMLINSDFLVDRRNGLKINVSESEIADAAKTSKNKARAVLNYILKKGFLPTQIADSFAIASGGATFYRNRVNTYLSEGMTQADAEAKAFQDFRETSEESQQSSRPDKVSQQQASSLGRVLLAFANTPMQYGRLTKRAYQDLIAGRGDRKSNISKIIYYTAVQNMIFNVLQQAVTMLGFGDDEKDDEEKEEKYIDVANGMADSILRGLGIAGGAVSVAKNFLLDLYERSGRTRPEYVDSVYKLLQFSPPISSKVSKIRQAAWMFDSKKRREEIYDKGFALDNPAYEAAGKVISATTNLPVDRVYNKVNNIDAALAEDTETWESVAMLLGWPEWQIKPSKKRKSKKGGYKSTGRIKLKTKSKSNRKVRIR